MAKNERLRLLKVETNVLSPDGQPYTLEMGDHNLFLGESATGKTGAIHAVELLTGACDDLAFKDEVEDTSVLLDLGPLRGAEGGEVFVVGTFSDGSVASWGSVRADGKAKTPKHNFPAQWRADALLPARQVHAFLRAGVDARRVTLLRWLGLDALPLDGVLAALPEGCRAAYTAMLADPKVAKAAKVKPPVDALPLVLDAADKSAKAKRASAKAADEAATSQRTRLAPRPTSENIAAALDALKEAEGDCARAEEAERRAAAAAQARSQTQGAADRLHEAEQNITEWQAYRQKLLPLGAEPGTAIPPHVAAALAVLERCVESGQTTCPTCGSAVGVEHFGAQLQAFRRVVAARFSGTDEERTAWRALKAQHDECTTQIEQWQEVAQSAVGTGAGGLAVLAMNEPYDGPPAADARAAEDRVRASYEVLRTTEAAWAAVDGMVKQSREDGDAAKAMQSLKDACREARDRLVADNVESFEAKVNLRLHLPGSPRFGVRLQAQGRETCDMGLWREVGGAPVLDTVLCGAEAVAVTAALADVITPSGHPAVVIPRERDVGAAHLASIMRGLSACTCQVVLTSTKRPRGKVPAGWTVVDFDGRAAQPPDEGAAAPPPVPPAEALGEPLEAAPSMPAAAETPMSKLSRDWQERVRALGYSDEALRDLRGEATVAMSEAERADVIVGILNNDLRASAATAAGLPYEQALRLTVLGFDEPQLRRLARKRDEVARVLEMRILGPDVSVLQSGEVRYPEESSGGDDGTCPEARYGGGDGGPVVIHRPRTREEPQEPQVEMFDVPPDADA